MKKVALIFTVLLVLTGCNEEIKWDDPNFQLWGAEAEIPSLYFYDYVNDKAVLSGNAQASYDIEITTTSDISGVFHLGRHDAAGYYKNDIIKEDFTLKRGKTYKTSGTTSFYGEIFDKAFILVDIKSGEGSNPATIKSSSVIINKKVR